MFRWLLLIPLLLLSCVRAVHDGPDVVLITIDTLRADRLGCYGYDRPTTPTIDAFAARGVRFSRALAASGSTAPSHATMFTGRHPRGHSIGPLNGYTRLEGITTLAERFQEAGYQTGGFISNVMLKSRLGFQQGFDHYDEELPTAERNRPDIFERLAPETVARALAWLNQRDPDRPFFLWVHVQDPHGPYTPPEEVAARFPPRDDPEKAELPWLSGNDGRGGIPAYQVLPGKRRASEYEALYDAEIAHADAALARLLDHGALGEAVVLLTADHGESMGEHGLYFVHSTSTWPPQAHVPFVLRAPGLAPAVVDEPVAHIDVLPTLLELAGLPPDPGAPGLPLVSQLDRAWPTRTLYCDLGSQLTAYRDDQLLYVWPADHAWRGDRALRPQFSAYTWETVGEEQRAVDPARRDAVRRYLENPVPMVSADAPSQEEVERLRSLGYVD